MVYIRTVKTSSGATAVQIVHSFHKGSREIEHIGSAHTEADVELLKAAARQLLHANQDTLDFGDGQPARGELPILSTESAYLWEALDRGYRRLGFDRACGHDEVFQALVLARLIEPTSKADTIRVIDEVGRPAPALRTIWRRLPVYAKPEWRASLSGACAAHVGLGPTTVLLYDVTTLYFETHEGDGFREPGFSKERRLEPQITVGLLTDARGFPLVSWLACNNCRAAAFNNSTSASVCAEPMCSISLDPLWNECTICTAVAPLDVFTVRMYTTRQG